MATYTSNLSLKKPAQSDKIRIADLNGNADNIDAAIGADFGQSSKPSINAAINSLADGLAIVAQGDVHAAISAGQFVYVRNHSTLAEGLYVASAAISANAALSGTNLTADTSGGLNALNSKFNSVPTFNTLTVPANGSATIALPPSGTRFMIGFNGSGIGARMGLWVMYSNATNSAIQEIKQSSVLSGTAGSDGIAFTNSTAAAQLVQYIIIEGT